MRDRYDRERRLLEERYLASRENMMDREQRMEELEKGYVACDTTELKRLRRAFVFSEPSRIKKATREEIRGMNLLLKEVDSYIFYMKNYDKLIKLGARTSPGLLLSGEPGMGKTLTARYVISQAGARAIDASSFPRSNKYWTKEDIKSLFSLAREWVKEKSQPIILFWDEFETVARERSKCSASEAEIATALTTEIDGLAGKSLGVIVVATTNYERDLDHALLRPGRMGHHIEFQHLATKGKEEILKYYVEKKAHDPGIDYESVSYLLSSRITPAGIEEMAEQAYLKACMKKLNNLEKARIETKELIELIIDDVMGTPSDIWLSKEEHFRIAVHEAGHAVLARLLGLPTQLVVTLPSGYQRGITIHRPTNSLPLEKFQECSIISGLGGRVADEIFGYSGNDECDVANNTKRAFELIATKFKNVNLLSYDSYHYKEENFKPLSNELRTKTEDKVFELIEKSYKKARDMLNHYGKKNIERVAKELVDCGFLVQNEIDELMHKEKLNNENSINCQ